MNAAVVALAAKRPGIIRAVLPSALPFEMVETTRIRRDGFCVTMRPDRPVDLASETFLAELRSASLKLWQSDD